MLRPDVELVNAALAGDETLAAATGCAVVPGWVTFRGALRSARADDVAWGSRFFVADEGIIGWGGYKGPPVEGTVEIGYEIAASRQNQGLATAAVAALVAEAFTDASVTQVIAHTLPERNASNRVLEKRGFRFAGDALERGRTVWRFELQQISDNR